jgi:hypothetical protein
MIIINIHFAILISSLNLKKLHGKITRPGPFDQKIQPRLNNH